MFVVYGKSNREYYVDFVDMTAYNACAFRPLANDVSWWMVPGTVEV